MNVKIIHSALLRGRNDLCPCELETSQLKDDVILGCKNSYLLGSQNKVPPYYATLLLCKAHLGMRKRELTLSILSVMSLHSKVTLDAVLEENGQ